MLMQLWSEKMNFVHCQSKKVGKNGIKLLKSNNDVLQQYVCNHCVRRFNERTGTPMAGLRTSVELVEMALTA